MTQPILTDIFLKVTNLEFLIGIQFLVIAKARLIKAPKQCNYLLTKKYIHP